MVRQVLGWCSLGEILQLLLLKLMVLHFIIHIYLNITYLSHIPSSFDAYQYISQYVRNMWQSEWDTAVNNKLHATKLLIGEQPSAYRSIHRDEVVLS